VLSQLTRDLFAIAKFLLIILTQLSNSSAVCNYKTEMEDGVLDPRQLVLNNVTLSDAGTYACHVTNTFGDVSSSAILTVVQPTATYGELAASRPLYVYVTPREFPTAPSGN